MSRLGPLTAVHVSPHPDDEALGAPAVLLRLVDAGWRVVHVVASLGSDPAHHERRRAEALEAAARGGWELRVATPVELVAELDDLDPDVWISPSPHDGHPAHEHVARELRDVIERTGTSTRWWMWGGWADLPMPTLYAPFGDDLLDRAQHVLAAYEGELVRNDYARLLTARASANAVLGSERVFGFGAPAASADPYAELLTEAEFDGLRWHLGAARLWEGDDLTAAPTGEDVGWWLHAPSVRDQRARPERPPGPGRT